MQLYLQHYDWWPTSASRSVAEPPGPESPFRPAGSRSLGFILGDQDLATLGPEKRREAYLTAINQQPVRNRRDAVQAIREFDLYQVAKDNGAVPVPRSKLPWLPKDGVATANASRHE